MKIDIEDLQGLLNTLLRANMSLIAVTNPEYFKMLTDANMIVDVPESMNHLKNSTLDLKNRLDAAIMREKLLQAAVEELSEDLIKLEAKK